MKDLFAISHPIYYLSPMEQKTQVSLDLEMNATILRVGMDSFVKEI